MMRAALVLVIASACSLQRLPPLRVQHGTLQPVHRVVVVATECRIAACAQVAAMVASELAFRGIEIVDLDRLPAREQSRKTVDVTKVEIRGGVERSSITREVTVTGPTYSEVDVWTLRAALTKLGVDGVVRVRVAELAQHPRRAFALVRITRPSDAELIVASACELEVSREDPLAKIFERAVRCALESATGATR